MVTFLIIIIIIMSCKQSKGDASTLKRQSEMRAEDLDARLKWYQKHQESDDEDRKWEHLQHHGVIFPQLYVRKNLPVKYEGKPIKLTDLQQELAVYWTQTLKTDWQKNEFYGKNYWQQFKKDFDKEKEFHKERFDYTGVQEALEKMKQERKNDQKEKLRRKTEKEENDKFYGHAIVDGVREKVSAYQIEGSTLFKGRGKHAKAGLFKRRVDPREIIINVGEDDPVPICPIPGQSWGQIVHKHDTTWLCGYKDTVKGAHKYIFLAANSKFKGANDRKKYEKARKLKKHIVEVRENYTKMLTHKEEVKRQLGTAVYLIDFLALRVGNEKGQDQADTQGTCSLRVEHIKIEPNDTITLDFLGKDSIQYVNTVKIRAEAYENIKAFVNGKRPADNIFHLIDTSMLNDYLKTVVPGLSLTAKVFRTYNASVTLQKELSKGHLNSMNAQQKLNFYNEANKQVAVLCNHQKAVSKNFDIQLEKDNKFLNAMNKYCKELEQHKRSVKSGHSKHKDTTEKITDKKELVKVFPSNLNAVEKQLAKMREKVEKEREKLKKKEENKQISLNTSKTNYNDPRISVSWCKNNQVKIQKVFPKTLQSKFIWAMYEEPDFQF